MPEKSYFKTAGRQLFSLIFTIALIVFILFLANITIGIVNFCSELNPVFGKAVLILLLALYALMLIWSVRLFFRFGPREKLDWEEIADNNPKYMKAILNRIKGNPIIKETPELRDEIRDILKYEKKYETQKVRDILKKCSAKLDTESKKVVKKFSERVFMSTAISQSGKLDAFFVLVLQLQMVFKIAKIYKQRPTFFELRKLYFNVFITVFSAYGIEEIEIDEYLENISGSVFGSIPLLGNIASLLTASIVDGTINAFFTLKLGMIAIKYSNFEEKSMKSKQNIKKAANRDAKELLGGVTKDSVNEIKDKLIELIKKKGGNAVDNVVDTIKKPFENLSDIFKKKEA